jgi:hypothetical protein
MWAIQAAAASLASGGALAQHLTLVVNKQAPDSLGRYERSIGRIVIWFVELVEGDKSACARHQVCDMIRRPTPKKVLMPSSKAL